MKKFFKKILFKSEKGITIVEMLLYMGILSVLLSILTSIFVSALDVQSESEAASSVVQDGNYIIGRLAYDIRRAQSINIPALGETNNNFQIVIDGVNYSYNLDANENLTLTNNLGVNNLNNYGTNASAFSVQRLGNPGKVEDTLRISFTLTGRAQRVSGSEVRNFQTNLALRRK